MSNNQEVCDPNKEEQVIGVDLISELEKGDLIVFKPIKGPLICMSRKELLAYWEMGGGGNKGNGWLWGDCVEPDPINPERVCKKYYNVPSTNQRVFPMVKKMIEENPNVETWIIGETQKKIEIGTQSQYHYEGESYGEQNIYSVCPEGKVCTLQELEGDIENKYPQIEDVLRQYDLYVENIELSDMQITTLPDSIGEFKNLKELFLTDNVLRTLPDSIGDLKKLEELELGNNMLKSLPDSIGELKNLNLLFMNNNALRTLPNSLGDLKNLEALDLGNNMLTSLPDSIGELKNLQVLNSSNNRLKNLPDGIGQLKKLEALRLKNNRLTTLPDSIGELKNLKTLDLGSNPITSLPKSIGKLNLYSIVIDPELQHLLPENLRSRIRRH